MKNMSSFYASTFGRILFATICCALWGGVFPVMKLTNNLLHLTGKDVGSLYILAGIRFFLSGLLVIMFFSITEKKLLVLKPKELGPTLTVSGIQTVGQYLFYYIGMATTSGVKSAIITGSTSFFAILCSSLMFRQEKLSGRKILSCLIGFCGIAAANLKGFDLNFSFTGEGFVMIAAIMSAIGGCFVKRFSSDTHVPALSGYQFLFGGIALTATGIALGGKMSFGEIGSILCVLYLSFAAAFAQTLWSVLLKYNDVSKVSVFRLTIPIFGASLSALFVPEEEISVSVIISLILVCVGITLANTTQKTKTVKFF